MSLRFIFGRSGSGKSRFCLDDIKSNINSNSTYPLILLVPDQFSFQSEKNLLNIAKEKGIMRAEVISFKRMAYRVFNEVGGITRKHLNNAGKAMLVHKIVGEVKEDLSSLARVSRTMGFVNTMCETITELKRYNVAPELMKSAESSMSNETLRGKIRDINLIYERFDKTINENYLDSDDDLHMLAEKLDSSHIFDGAEIWIDEFSTFTPQQYIIIEKLLKKAKRVNVCLCSDCANGKCDIDSADVFSPVKNTERKLLRICEESNIPYDEPMMLNTEPIFRFKENAELQHLEKSYFSYPYKTYNHETESISLFKAVNLYSEVEYIARDILRLCRDKGARFRDIAVVTRDLDSYEKVIQVVFSQYDIPYFIDQKRDINGNPFVILVNSIIEIFTKNWSYESVFRYLKTGLTGIDREEIDIVENYVIACGIKGSRWTDNAEWSFLQNDKDKEYLSAINDIKKKVNEPLIGLFNRIDNSRNAKEICTAVYDFLCELKIPDRIEDWIEKFKVSGDYDKANEYTQIWNMIMELFDQIVEVSGDNELRLEQFVKLLTVGISQCQLGVIPATLDEVLIGDVERVKSHGVDNLYIIGVNDGVFPSSSNEEGILSDQDREELKELGIELAVDTKTRAFEEQFLIYTALTMSGENIKITYPIADFEGKTKRPSIIISRLKKIFPLIKERSNIVKIDSDDENLGLVSSSISTFNELVSVIRSDYEGLAIKPIWKDVYRWYIKDDNWRDKCRKSIEGLSYTNQVDSIAYQKVKKLYGNPMKISISRLEKYVECPFAYYVQYGLKAKDRKKYEFTSPDVGNFMHDILLKFSDVMEKEKMTWRDMDKNWCSEAVCFLVDQEINDNSGLVLNSSARYKYMADRIKRILTRSLTLASEHIKRSGFDPIGYELSFSERGDFPPIVLELPSGDTVELEGRIDRLDALTTEDGTYIRIVDYKSGNKAFKLSDVYYCLQIQLLIYLDAILTNKSEYGNGGFIPGAILYFRLDDPLINSLGEASSDEIEKQIMKKLKMNGLLLKDAKIIKEMDRDIDGYSLIIPARINKDGSLGKSSAASMEEFELLRKYVRDSLINMCGEILDGNITIMPYKKKDFTPCGYCKFSAICRFDPTLSGNKYKILNNIKDDEVWQLIGKEHENND